MWGRRQEEPQQRFLKRFPRYAETGLLDELRLSDYRYLDAEGHCYLDYTGAGLVADAQLHAHASRIRSGVYGNPHSDSPSSLRSTELVESTRDEILRFFRADPREYTVIFTANATGGCRLIGESFPFRPGGRLLLTLDNHNSVNGIREYARTAGAALDLVPLRTHDLRVVDDAVPAALRKASGPGNLLCYPAQSNLTGVQHPLDWIAEAHRYGWRVLLDAAAFAPTNVLDLSRYHPDFVTVSWYKVFGYPTGIGTLLARREALADLRRPWFSGGTIQAVSAQGDWFAPEAAPAAFEDGTVNFLLIPDVAVGLRWINRIGLDTINTRVGCLTGWVLEELQKLRHTNGRRLVHLHGPADARDRGPTITFNLLDPSGTAVDERTVSRRAAEAMISLRTGCFCNPGAGEAMLGVRPERLRDQKYTTIDRYLADLGVPVGGGIRVSFGLASTFADAQRFLRWVVDTFRDSHAHDAGLPPRVHC